jgi:ribosome-associated translation inhibitor RaiA
MKPATQLLGQADNARVSVRVHVIGKHPICAQARAYAEYRVFAALTLITETQRVRRARVVLRSVDGKGDGECVTCTVTVALGGVESFRVRATGAHAYAAINRAAERIIATSAPGVVGRVSL